jgi:hypothetical protein
MDDTGGWSRVVGLSVDPPPIHAGRKAAAHPAILAAAPDSVPTNGLIRHVNLSPPLSNITPTCRQPPDFLYPSSTSKAHPMSYLVRFPLLVFRSETFLSALCPLLSILSDRKRNSTERSSPNSLLLGIDENLTHISDVGVGF